MYGIVDAVAIVQLLGEAAFGASIDLPRVRKKTIGSCPVDSTRNSFVTRMRTRVSTHSALVRGIEEDKACREGMRSGPPHVQTSSFTSFLVQGDRALSRVWHLEKIAGQGILGISFVTDVTFLRMQF